MKKIALITPPFTQLSSPYSAMPFLSGTLNHFKLENFQIDLSIETAIKFFTKKNITQLFKEIEKTKISQSLNIFINNKNKYINTIESVINFLQGKNQALSYRIISGNFLPENKRFDILDNFEFSDFDIIDLAKFMASLYIDDICDLAKKTVIPHFSLNAYNEKIAVSPENFDELYNSVNENDIISEIMFYILSKYNFSNVNIIGITIPFPGNLYSALKIGKWFKTNYPEIKIVFGGGYVNTELRFLADNRMFEFTDFICFDDGELPLLRIIDFVNNRIDKNKLVRTMMLENNLIKYFNEPEQMDIFGIESGIPDYKNLKLDLYFTLTETTNKMHKLWSERNFIKLRLAHGCYHHKCTFCDTNLDYINNYKVLNVNILINQIETVIEQIGITTFHFIDEAMPPKLIKDFCNEIIKKNINITWWGNIRFDLSFDNDLCNLMSDAGCIAVTGGLESANNRILELMKKNTTIEQIIKVCRNFSDAGILIHAYLIYGFPTETINELVNSLEIIRQMFENDLIQSAYYHRFALTIHSPIMQNPDFYDIKILKKEIKNFANNEITYIDNKNLNIDLLESGLSKAIYNYNYGNCLEENILFWFENMDIKISVPKKFVINILKN